MRRSLMGVMGGFFLHANTHCILHTGAVDVLTFENAPVRDTNCRGHNHSTKHCIYRHSEALKHIAGHKPYHLRHSHTLSQHPHVIGASTRCRQHPVTLAMAAGANR